MHKSLAVTALSLLMLVSFSSQAEEKKTTQQSKMSACSKEAKEKGLRGEERKEFMSTCLSSGHKGQQQQTKMTTCNKEASEKALKGAERKSFMSNCLRA